MYINDLGIGRTAVADNVNSSMRTSKLMGRKSTEDYATVMKKAVENQKTSVFPAFSSVGDLIIQEAFRKMETDPEWEAAVMDKVKDYYAGDSVSESIRKNAQNQTSQSSLQNDLLKSLLSVQNGFGYGLSGYSPYGWGNAAALAYGSVMNGAASSSLFGNWML